MTTSMWQQTEEMAKKQEQSGGHWLKLAGDGDKAVVVFLGEPCPREVAFVDGKYVEFDDKLKAQGHKASLRVALNVALFDSKEVKVLEQGVMFFKDLVRVREKYGLEKWAFEIQRHGAAKDPKTSYTILPEHQLSAEQQKVFLALPQHDLVKLYAAEADMDLARELRERRQASCRCGWLPSSGESHPCHWQNYSCEKPGTERQVSPGYITWDWDGWSSRQRAIGCWRAASTRHTGGV